MERSDCEVCRSAGSVDHGICQVCLHETVVGVAPKPVDALVAASMDPRPMIRLAHLVAAVTAWLMDSVAPISAPFDDPAVSWLPPQLPRSA
ncbi:MAG TPA: hypothetical protein VJ818_06120 [Actinomycetota bacterium]|nr:hypothetical protein [Actinomycetota bacterium]